MDCGCASVTSIKARALCLLLQRVSRTNSDNWINSSLGTTRGTTITKSNLVGLSQSDIQSDEHSVTIIDKLQ